MKHSFIASLLITLILSGCSEEPDFKRDPKNTQNSMAVFVAVGKEYLKQHDVDRVYYESLGEYLTFNENDRVLFEHVAIHREGGLLETTLHNGLRVTYEY